MKTRRVAARTSSFAFKGKNTAIDEISRALRVASVIAGSVRKSGNRVRITVQFVKAADGYHVWSETYEREMTDIFAVQDEIAAQVAQKLGGGPTTPTAPTAVAPTKNIAAYDTYLRGRAAQMKGSSPALLDEAIHHYQEATRLDPGYALARAQLARIYVLYWVIIDRSAGVPGGRARSRARRANGRGRRCQPPACPGPKLPARNKCRGGTPARGCA